VTQYTNDIKDSLLDVLVYNSDLQSGPTQLMPAVHIKTSFHQPAWIAHVSQTSHKHNTSIYTTGALWLIG